MQRVGLMSSAQTRELKARPVRRRSNLLILSVKLCFGYFFSVFPLLSFRQLSRSKNSEQRIGNAQQINWAKHSTYLLGLGSAHKYTVSRPWACSRNDGAQTNRMGRNNGRRKPTSRGDSRFKPSGRRKRRSKLVRPGRRRRQGH